MWLIMDMKTMLGIGLLAVIGMLLMLPVFQSAQQAATLTYGATSEIFSGVAATAHSFLYSPITSVTKFLRVNNSQAKNTVTSNGMNLN